MALRAVVSASSSYDNAPDRSLAATARLAGSLIYAMFQLKEATHPVGVNII